MHRVVSLALAFGCATDSKLIETCGTDSEYKYFYYGWDRTAHVSCNT